MADIGHIEIDRAIRHLHTRVGDWMLVAKALRFAKSASTVTDDVRTHAREREHGLRVALPLGVERQSARRSPCAAVDMYCKQPMPDEERR